MADHWSDSTETEALLARIRSGQRAAFNDLFDRHRPELRRAVQLRLDRRLSSRLDASDIVQEAQMVAYRRLEDYLNRRPMPFALWLRKTAQERLRDHRRANLLADRRSIDREVVLPDHSSMLLAVPFLRHSNSPSQGVSRREYQRTVTEAVAKLGEVDREILLMRNVEGLSQRQIAEILEMSHDAVRKRYGRAVIKLQQLLAGLDFSELDS